MESHTGSIINKIKAHLKPKELTELGDNSAYPCLVPDSTKARGNKGNRCYECSACCYWNMISHFNQRTIEAVIKCVRMSLDSLKRKTQLPSRYSAGQQQQEQDAKFNAYKTAFLKVCIT